MERTLRPVAHQLVLHSGYKRGLWELQDNMHAVLVREQELEREVVPGAASLARRDRHAHRARLSLCVEEDLMFQFSDRCLQLQDRVATSSVLWTGKRTRRQRIEQRRRAQSGLGVCYTSSARRVEMATDK